MKKKYIYQKDSSIEREIERQMDRKIDRSRDSSNKRYMD